MDRAVFAVAISLVAGCDTGGLIIVETFDASADAVQDVIEDAEQPLTPIVDAAVVCTEGSAMCNGGTGVCTDPVQDCPQDNECCSFECVPVEGKEYKACKGVLKDGGP